MSEEIGQTAVAQEREMSPYRKEAKGSRKHPTDRSEKMRTSPGQEAATETEQHTWNGRRIESLPDQPAEREETQRAANHRAGKSQNHVDGRRG